jgi:3-oxoacyl-[acyl-carrier-protein] synthase-1
MQIAIIADNIISSLGATAVVNYEQVKAGNSGIKLIDDPNLLPVPFYASSITQVHSRGLESYTRLEQLGIASINDALNETTITLHDSDTLLILATTKGNINCLSTRPYLVPLAAAAARIGDYFKAYHSPIVISNACISGLQAIIVARRLLMRKQYKHMVVVGIDELSPFVLSGFHSLMAMSDSPCRPFDKSRNGINLGEAAATVVMTSEERLISGTSITITGEAVTNDANHISGPSRTGAELAHAIDIAMRGTSMEELSFISAHGTATKFNDEMESKAFDTAGIATIPTLSLKGYFGHTLGASGLLESIISYHGLRDGLILASKNFEQNGTSKHLNINTVNSNSAKTKALKTASGFGGCNAAVVYSTLQ